MINKKLLLSGITVLMLLLSADVAAQHPHDGHYRPDTTALKRTQRLGEVVVRGKYVDRVNKSVYNAVAIDTRKLRNTNLDLAHALDRVAGIKIREEGGVGSAVQLNLNGFTGQHVKVFIDGMPMDNSNTSFGLNNIPAGFASQLQVYKGVVPVDFGGDAIGGVINIVTDHSPRTCVDASYSYGSFNTHRSNIALGWTGKRGFVVRFNAYQNYSDNDYKVKTQWTDLSNSTISNEEGWFRRFHDRYHNEAAVLRQGSVDEAKGGIGAGKMGTRIYQLVNGKLIEKGKNIVTNFGNVGVFGNYSYGALNSDMGVNYFTAAGAMTSWTAPDLTKFAVDDKAPVISDILDLGNNRLAITLYYSNRDSAAVVFSDYSFSTVNAPVFDSRIGGIYGAWRSARYAMGGVADDGTAYVFCGTSADGSKVGALRIKKSATSFDPDYKFDIYTASEGYRFRKAYPISGSKFLLEFYVKKDEYSNMSTSGKLAIADMDTKTLTWVTGVPAASDMANYSIGYGDGYDGYFYLPINPAEASTAGGGGSWHHAKATRATSSAVPTIYRINAATGVATAFMTLDKNESVKVVSIVKK